MGTVEKYIVTFILENLDEKEISEEETRKIKSPPQYALTDNDGQKWCKLAKELINKIPNMDSKTHKGLQLHWLRDLLANGAPSGRKSYLKSDTGLGLHLYCSRQEIKCENLTYNLDFDCRGSCEFSNQRIIFWLAEIKSSPKGLQKAVEQIDLKKKVLSQVVKDLYPDYDVDFISIVFIPREAFDPTYNNPPSCRIEYL